MTSFALHSLPVNSALSPYVCGTEKGAFVSVSPEGIASSEEAGFFFPPLEIDTQMNSSWFLRCIKMDIVTISVEFAYSL